MIPAGIEPASDP